MSTLGQVAYEKYNEAKGGKTWDGKPIPPWESLTDDVGLAVQNAWEVAARAAADEMVRRWAPDNFITQARRLISSATACDQRAKACAITKLDEARLWWTEAAR
jgi:hypothetical protein